MAEVAERSRSQRIDLIAIAVSEIRATRQIVDWQLAMLQQRKVTMQN